MVWYVSFQASLTKKQNECVHCGFNPSSTGLLDFRYKSSHMLILFYNLLNHIVCTGASCMLWRGLSPVRGPLCCSVPLQLMGLRCSSSASGPPGNGLALGASSSAPLAMHIQKKKKKHSNHWDQEINHRHSLLQPESMVHEAFSGHFSAQKALKLNAWCVWRAVPACSHL